MKSSFKKNFFEISIYSLLLSLLISANDTKLSAQDTRQRNVRTSSFRVHPFISKTQGAPSTTAGPTDPGVQINAINTILTSNWSPPSPDPAGITYFAPFNTLLISDSEVNEIPALFTGVNLFESTLSGSLVNTYSSTAFSYEPTGIAFNPVNEHIFISDDYQDSVFELDWGEDKIFGTTDDVVTSFDTRLFGSKDPEGVCYDSWQGHLYIADGESSEIYEIGPGPNEIFDGVPPTGDDTFLQFDTSVLGLTDPDGIEFNAENGNLFILGYDDKVLFETTTSGDLVRLIDIEFLNARSPSGLAFAPSSMNPTVLSLYIADRGMDNDLHPDENDGKIYEIDLSEISALAVEAEPKAYPVEFILHANYPNPFNPTTNLKFEIPVSATAAVETRLEIYNSLGQLVRTLLRKELTAGQYEVSWDGTNDNLTQASSGIYYARLSANQFTRTIKMTLIR